MPPSSLDEALAQAADPQTSADEFAGLAKHPSDDVRRRVATNPSTPVPILIKLMSRFGAEVSRNAAWPVLLLADPMLLARHEVSLRIQWASTPAVAGWMLEVLLASSDEVGLVAAVAGNASCPPERLARLLVDRRKQVRAAAAGNPRCPVEELERLAYDDAYEVLMAVAGNPGAPPDLLERL
ncbi:MAG: hypothetical protein EOO75_20555, partial [Myxococcales bacterium]